MLPTKSMNYKYVSPELFYVFPKKLRDELAHGSVMLEVAWGLCLIVYMLWFPVILWCQSEYIL
jgi:hypothetical protein